MKAAAMAVVIAAGIWLVGVALLMALRPASCHKLIAKMTSHLEASSWRLQLTEQGLRVLVGVALIVHAPASKFPYVFQAAGWVLTASSLVILLAPIRWHGRYGRFLTEHLTPSIIRALSPVPVIAGAGLVYASM